MINLKKIKQKLKNNIKKQELDNNFSITFSTNIKNVLKKSRVLKTQYLQSPFVKIKNKKQIKFPLNVITFNSTSELITHNQTDQIPQSISKLNSIIILNKNSIKKTILNEKELLKPLKENLSFTLKSIQIFNSQNN